MYVYVRYYCNDSRCTMKHVVVSTATGLSAAGLLVHHVRMGGKIKACVEQLPQLQLEASIQPITRTVLRVKLTIYCRFRWNDKVSQPLLL